MTSYELGFCKKAEEYGVDPVMLKEAGSMPNQGQLLKMLKGVHIPRKFSFKNNPLFLTSGQKEKILKYVESLPDTVIGKSRVGSGTSVKGFFSNPFYL